MRDTFKSALAAAIRRLERAMQERAVALEKISALNREIPDLERTINALEQQLGVTNQEAHRFHDVEVAIHNFPNVAESSQLVNEEDLLPEIEGQPILPED